MDAQSQRNLIWHEEPVSAETLQKPTLIERPGSVAVKGIEEGAEQVTEDGGPRAAGHQVEGQQGQNHTGVTCRGRQQVTGEQVFQDVSPAEKHGPKALVALPVMIIF